MSAGSRALHALGVDLAFTRPPSVLARRGRPSGRPLLVRCFRDYPVKGGRVRARTRPFVPLPCFFAFFAFLTFLAFGFLYWSIAGLRLRTVMTSFGVTIRLTLTAASSAAEDA